MKIKIKILVIILFLANPVFAYIDPGTGSMVAQILIAFVATCLCFFKSIVASLKEVFRKIFRK